ncbi:MAG: phosphomannose isomerase type II C-terminal cupin domain [Alphaproteobacteria bacterium]|nr:phosphomannose isomerase type II C-terminal cupin domain [Alphaproteobacteria bacterium]
MAVNYKKGDKDQRPWGSWEVLDAGLEHIVKKIIVLPEKKLSLQKHNHRSEHWTIAQGAGIVTLGDRTFETPQNSHVFIGVGQIHRMENASSGAILTFIEVQTGRNLDEDDIVRLEDDYGRT